MDTSKFPIRNVTIVENASEFSKARGISKFLTLDCGHTVGLKDGIKVPQSVPCYDCYKAENAPGNPSEQ